MNEKGGEKMKKVLFGILALSTLAFSSEQGTSYVNLRLGLDAGSQYSPVSTHDDVAEFALGSETDGIGYEIAAEILYPSNERLDFGVGIAFQDHAKRDSQTLDTYWGDDGTYEGLDYQSVPVYFTAQYKLSEDSKFNPYLKANFGYSFNVNEQNIESPSGDGYSSDYSHVDIKNGLYYAFGVGAEYENFTVDLMYSVNKATAEVENGVTMYDLDVDADYERWVLAFGYKFDLK
jgi:hypothetical protein